MSNLRKKHVLLIATGLVPRLREKLIRTGILELPDSIRFAADLNDGGRIAQEHLQHAAQE